MFFAGLTFAAVYETDTSWENKKRQPGNIDYAVQQIKELKNNGATRLEIARRATSIADIQIINQNDLERMTVLDNWQFWGNPMAENQEAWDHWDAIDGINKQYDEQAKWVYKNRFGQCSENSCLVYYLLKKAGIEGEIRIFGAPDHAYVVWGMDAEADPQKEESWTDQVITLDSWNGKVFVGKDAYNDEYIEGDKTVDGTDIRDHSAPGRCGLWDPQKNTPCCKKKPPCRNDPRMVCLDDVCKPCGSIKRVCCEGDVCKFDNLECEEGFCVKKVTTTTTTSSTTTTTDEVDDQEMDQATGVTTDEKYKPVDCDTKIPEGSRWYDSKYNSLYRQGYGNPSWIGELQWFFDEEKTKWAIRECYDENNKLHGPYMQWYENGQIKKEIIYKHGQQHGFSKTYYENGEPRNSVEYKDGKKHGKDYSYREDGTVIHEFNYVDGLQSGTQKTYHLNGNLKKQWEMSEGEASGDSVEYYEDGTLYYKNTGTYKDGKFTGTVEKISPSIGHTLCKVTDGEYHDCEYI